MTRKPRTGDTPLYHWLRVSSNRVAPISPQSRDLLALTLIPGLGPVRIDRLIQAAGSPGQVMSMSLNQLTRVSGIGSRTAGSIVESRATVADRVEQELDKLINAGASIVSVFDDGYPSLLKATPTAPPILQYKGSLESMNHRHPIAMVGSRKCTIYGHEQAARFAKSLSASGMCVVSGGARGVDSAAHKGAMDAGGQTVVVLGCGLGHVYPSENAELFDRVIDTGGAVISELPFSTPPSSENFPARNRIISGLSLGVLVVEASRKSGALITATHAVEDHNREVFAIPGRVDSSASTGSNELLKNGAHLVTDPNEIIEILERSAETLKRGARSLGRAPTNRDASQAQPSEPIGEVDPIGKRILEALQDPLTGDQLAEKLNIEPGQLRAAATMLEIQGRIQRSGPNFVRTR
ncbi:MAG: DNA-processing protein DprA [Phycisphaerales bacterium]